MTVRFLFLALFGATPAAPCAPSIDLTPNPAAFGDAVKILLRDFPPKQAVAIQVRATNDLGQVWQSHATFRSDSHGDIDVATQSPISGTYRHADASGLFWSMSLPDTNKIIAKPAHDKLKPVNLYLTAGANGTVLASAKLQRLFLTPGMKQIPLHDGKLRGAFFIPAEPGPHPAIIILGGSEGGLHEADAAYFASKGYAALALAYFAYDDLPGSLENIPLEYFQSAIIWLQSRPEVRSGQVAVFGVSRGAELALLLGSKFPQIKAVVAMAPSGVIWGGANDTNRTQLPAWTWQGLPLPFMQFEKLTLREKWQVAKIVQTPPISFAPVFRMMLKIPGQAARAAIPVENINGPVLLVSGNDDDVWPSSQMADAVMKRLKHASHPFPDLHLAYKKVGHFFPLPNFPATVQTLVEPGMNAELSLGGDTGHTAAAANSWIQIIQFLDSAFQSPKRP